MSDSLPAPTKYLDAELTTPQTGHSGSSFSRNGIITGPQATIVVHPDVARIHSWQNDYSLKAGLNRKYWTYVPAPIPTGACILWDPGCESNFSRPQAVELFWGLEGMAALQIDACFAADNRTFDCDTSALAPASSSLSAAVKSYMLGPRCSTDRRWYQENYVKDLDGVYQRILSNTVDTQYLTWSQDGLVQKFPPGITDVERTETDMYRSCCGDCNVYADTVEVNYWPQPGPDDSCFSIIGDKVEPELDDATTDIHGVVFWGTTTTTSDLEGEHSEILTTATLASIDSVTFKNSISFMWVPRNG